MNVLIVHAHHEPQSFSSALCKQAASTLETAGHDVVVSDLWGMGFDPVSDRRNFTTSKDPDYLKQQVEETYASETNGFAADIEAELTKLEQCDALIFNFPLWWFGMPAILKGWCDRVLAMGRVYGGPKRYEGGIGQATKRGMVIMTTGGGQTAYDGWGPNPSLEAIMTPIQHGVFWFNGFRPLAPFVAWSPARISPTERTVYLQQLDSRLQTLFDEPPVRLPMLADFPDSGHDQQNRYMVVVRRRREPDDQYTRRVPDEIAHIARLKRDGILLDFHMAPAGHPNWRAFMTFRAVGQPQVEAHLRSLPLAEYLDFDITPLARP